MEDREILDLLRARDERALALLEERYGPMLRRLAERITGSPEDAEECVSDAFLRLWSAVPLPELLHLRAWLMKCVRGLALDRARMAAAEKRGGGAVPALLDELAECLGGADTAESELLARELGAAVDAFLRRQSERDRRLFLLRYFCGMRNAEAARRCGLRENSAAVALKRLRQRLRDELTKEGLIP